MTRSTAKEKAKPSGDVWTEILSEVGPSINPQTFKDWFGPSRLLPSSNGKLRIQVPTLEFVSRIQDEWGAQLAEAARKKGFANLEFFPEQSVSATVEEKHDEIEVEDAKESRTYSSKCPEAPADAWYGDAKVYRSIIGPRVESSDNFHLACFLTLVGSALGKSIFINAGRITYPNFYTVIVGDSAWAAKGTAMAPLDEISPQINPALIPLSSLDSGQGLIRAIKASREASGQGHEGCVLVTVDEFNSVLNKAKIKGSSLIPDLKKAFDSPPVLELNVSQRVRVPNAPTISIIAASEPNDLSDMSIRDLKGGLGNRLVYVPGDPKPLNPDSSMPRGDDWLQFIVGLRKTIDFYRNRGKTEMVWSDKAKVLWTEFFKGVRKRGADDPIISNLAARHRAYVPRASLVFAALDRSERLIEAKHVRAAIAFCDFLLESLYYIFRSADVKPWVKESKDIVDYVARKDGVPMRALRNRFHRLGAETFERRLRYLLADDMHPDRELAIDERRGVSGRVVHWVVVND